MTVTGSLSRREKRFDFYPESMSFVLEHKVICARVQFFFFFAHFVTHLCFFVLSLSLSLSKGEVERQCATEILQGAHVGNPKQMTSSADVCLWHEWPVLVPSHSHPEIGG